MDDSMEQGSPMGQFVATGRRGYNLIFNAPFKFPHDSVFLTRWRSLAVKCAKVNGFVGHPSHFLNSIESGGFISTVSLPTSFQLVDSTVPLLSCFCV